MSKTTNVHPSDIRGFSRLAVDATEAITDLVEAMHHNIAHFPTIFTPAAQGRTRGITGLVYRSIRGVTRLVGYGLDSLYDQIMPLLGENSPPVNEIHSSPAREATIAALNGVLGDYLTATNNPLAISMNLRYQGRPLKIERAALQETITRPSSRVVVLLHGLCMNDLLWTRQGHNHGAALESELGCTPIYLRYNSGLHISTNGRAFSALMEELIREWPVEISEITIIGYSMGGLLSRSAQYYGKISEHQWLKYLRRLIFIGTPHHGTLWERGGNMIDRFLDYSPYTAPLARLGKIRSAGITDLRYGNLIDEDWQGQDRFEHKGDIRCLLSLPDDVACYSICATIGKEVSDLRAHLLGDGLVPLTSALGQHEDPRRNLSIPPSQTWVGYRMYHLDLLSRPEVYQQIKNWLNS